MPAIFTTVNLKFVAGSSSVIFSPSTKLPKNLKNQYAKFLHADCVDDHFDPLDYWKYEDVYGGGCFDVGGSFKGFDWIDEHVGSDDRLLQNTLPGETFNEMYMEDQKCLKIRYQRLFWKMILISWINGLQDYCTLIIDGLPFSDADYKDGSIHLYVDLIKQNLGKYYYKNMEWEEDDAGLRCCSSTPFDTRFERKIIKSKKTGVIHDEGASRKRKKSLVNGDNKGKEKVFEDEGVDKKQKKTLVNGGSKGKEKVFEDECMCSNGNKGIVTIYKRAMVNEKAKMVEVVSVVKTGRNRGVVIGALEAGKCTEQVWSLNDGFVCLSTSILCSSTKAFGLEGGSIRRIQVLDTAYWGFLGVGTKLDIFQNIHILFLEYSVLSLSGYGVLSFNPLWSLVSAGTDTPYLP
ncbi:hypothetical protein Tco_0137652 [Tanacetum coccineum]